MSKIRINKFLSVCGVSSRRGAESLIVEGKVTLNDKTVIELGTIIDSETDIVKVDGVEISPVEKKYYIALNKPNNTMTTLHDPFKRRTVLHFLKELKMRIYPVGRLDYDTQGILLLTNDGELAYRLTHPKYNVQKIYEANVKGKFSKDAIAKISKGIKLEDGAIGRAEVSILSLLSDQSKIRLILTEGRKREVKQLCKAVGFPVIILRRVEFAGIRCGRLSSGQWRHLTEREVDQLYSLAGLTERA